MKVEKKVVTYEVPEYITDDGKTFNNESAALAHEAYIKMHTIPDFSFSELGCDFYIAKTIEDAKILRYRYDDCFDVDHYEYPLLILAKEYDGGGYTLEAATNYEVAALKEFLKNI